MPSKKQKPRRGLAVLSPREKQVVRLVADGIGTVPISRKLAISDKTVRTHLQNVLRKLGLHSRLELVVLVLQGKLA